MLLNQTNHSASSIKLSRWGLAVRLLGKPRSSRWMFSFSSGKMSPHFQAVRLTTFHRRVTNNVAKEQETNPRNPVRQNIELPHKSTECSTLHHEPVWLTSEEVQAPCWNLKRRQINTTVKLQQVRVNRTVVLCLVWAWSRLILLLCSN